MKNVALIISILLLGSCVSKDSVSVEALKAYVLDPDHGTLSTIEKGNMKLQASYYPKDLIIEQDLGMQDPVAWDSAAMALDSIDYFILRLSRDGKDVEAQFVSDDQSMARVRSYINHIGEHIYLQCDDEKTSPEDVVYYPAMGTSNATTVLIIFNSKLSSRSGKVSMIFEDTFFKTGRNEFAFDVSDLKNVPVLKR